MTITDLLTELGIEYAEAGDSPHVRDGWLGLRCPYCDQGAGNFGLGIHLSSKACSCWKCGRHLLTTVLSDITGKNRGVARALLDKVGLPSQGVQTPSRGILCKPEGILDGPIHPAHARYLRDRGFNPDQLSDEWGVKSIGIHPTLGWRLWIPVTLNGKVMSWTTRSISDKPGTRRYIAARPDQEVMSAKRLLFGMDKARHTAVVVEGPLDAVAIGPGAVATMGIAYTAAQAALIAQYPTRVVAFDSEPEAQRQAAKLCRELSGMDGRTYQVELSTGKDASRADREEIKELRERFLQ